MINILATTTRVEAPFIEVTIGSFVFGKYSRTTETTYNSVAGLTRQVKEYFPNYINQIDITKVNGSVNIYSIQLIYAIEPGADPNKIDKILSNVATTRTILISYGDCNSPSSIYREEQAIITGVQQSFDIASSKISYTISAVSSATLAQGSLITRGRIESKPSTQIIELLNDVDTGLSDIFYGMRTAAAQKQLIATDDKQVVIEAKTNITVLDYLNYLVTCMQKSSDVGQQRHRYVLTCHDDVTGDYGGPYFTVKEVANNIQDAANIGTYELNIGYPDATPVISFNVNTSDAYAILYNYSEKQKNQNYVWTIDDAGNYERIEGSPLLKSKELLVPTEAEKTWWAQMTQYPISAEVTIKGLLRPALLMTYVKLNVLFYGRSHSSSGTYIITKQKDTVSANGYRTTLSLTRIQGESL